MSTMKQTQGPSPSHRQTRRMLAALALSVTPLLGVSHAMAQCPAGWVSGIGVPGISNNVTSVAVIPGGDVIAAGFFSSAGGVPANNIARYNPATNTWSPLGSGANNKVNALAVLPNGDVIVGGVFPSAGGLATTRIARYTPSTNTWSPMGTGVNEIVYSLAALPDGDVVAGGAFSIAGGVAAHRIARYHPATNTWSPLGAGTNISVYSLAVLPTAAGFDIIAGGAFTSAGGVPANNIARYNPVTGVWSPLGSGTDGTVLSLAVLPNAIGGDVIAGGEFFSAGGVSGTPFIARYGIASGTWSSMGSGVGNSVQALAVLPSGDVVAGGFFDSAGNTPVSNIARYNLASNTWFALGAGTDSTVYDFAVLPNAGKDELFVGGWFSTAGGVTANGVARYSFAVAAPVISAEPQSALACGAGTASVSVTATGSGPLTYQWQIETAPGVWQTMGNDPAPLPCGGASYAYATPINSPTASIGIHACAGVSSYKVRSVVSSACGSVTSNAVRVYASPADVGRQGGQLGADGLHDNNDFIVFIDKFFAADPMADIGVQGGTLGTDGMFDNNDFVEFINLFFAGC
jgi:hypothetical protein